MSTKYVDLCTFKGCLAIQNFELSDGVEICDVANFRVLLFLTNIPSTANRKFIDLSPPNRLTVWPLSLLYWALETRFSTNLTPFPQKQTTLFLLAGHLV